ncbi:MAG: HEAT repeat domain-containing protein [Ignavibacteriaceae bacterium]|nr:HEAT repeat domain-containing protein [Ignavibacteriaceae bacterium]
MVQRSFKSLVLVILSLFVFTAAAYPQQVQVKRSSINNPYIAEKEYNDVKFTKFIENLSVAIQADNSGLRKSAIYLAGLYSLYEVVPVLVAQLENETDDDIKVLIALALYRMEDPVGIDAVEKLYKSASNGRVKRMSKAIVDNFRNKFAHLEISER